MAEHAVLSASSAERWITCPASVQLSKAVERSVPGMASKWAEEGTLAHELAFLHASLTFGKITNRQFQSRLNKWVAAHPELTVEQRTEMTTHARGYVAFLQERMAVYPHSSLLLEQRLPSGIEDCWGTSDAVIVSPQHVEIVDLKYGMGVQVDAEGNPQLRIYALGALDEFADLLGETEVIITSIYQPRLNHISSETLLPDDLRDWREVVRPVARAALDGSGEFHPTLEACRWCPAAGICRARVEAVTAVDFATDPEMLSPTEIGEYLHRVEEIRNWCDAIVETSLQMAYTGGKDIPGWKVVLSGGRRFVSDEDGALVALQKHGKPLSDVVNQKIKGIGELEKMLGKKDFQEILGPYLDRSPGKPAMAVIDDKREAISPNTEAQKEFGDVSE